MDLAWNRVFVAYFGPGRDVRHAINSDYAETYSQGPKGHTISRASVGQDVGIGSGSVGEMSTHGEFLTDLGCRSVGRTEGMDKHEEAAGWETQDNAEEESTTVRRMGRPIAAEWKWMSHLENQTSFDQESPPHQCYYAKSASMTLDDISLQFAAELRMSLTSLPTQYSHIEINGLGGAMKDRKMEDSPFSALRDADWMCNVIVAWSPDENVPRVNEFSEWCTATMMRLARSGLIGPSYVNMIADGRPQSNLFAPNISRLREIKSKYDPDNFWWAQCQSN